MSSDRPILSKLNDSNLHFPYSREFEPPDLESQLGREFVENGEFRTASAGDFNCWKIAKRLRGDVEIICILRGSVE
jgi:hypothetical protein